MLRLTIHQWNGCVQCVRVGEHCAKPSLLFVSSSSVNSDNANDNGSPLTLQRLGYVTSAKWVVGSKLIQIGSPRPHSHHEKTNSICYNGFISI